MNCIAPAHYPVSYFRICTVMNDVLTPSDTVYEDIVLNKALSELLIGGVVCSHGHNVHTFFLNIWQTSIFN